MQVFPSSAASERSVVDQRSKSLSTQERLNAADGPHTGPGVARTGPDCRKSIITTSFLYTKLLRAIGPDTLEKICTQHAAFGVFATQFYRR